MSTQIHTKKQSIQRTRNSRIFHDQTTKSTITFFNKNDEHIVVSTNELLEILYVVDILNKVSLSSFLLRPYPRLL